MVTRFDNEASCSHPISALSFLRPTVTKRSFPTEQSALIATRVGLSFFWLFWHICLLQCTFEEHSFQSPEEQRKRLQLIMTSISNGQPAPLTMRQPKDIECWGHRGASAHLPENT